MRGLVEWGMEEKKQNEKEEGRVVGGCVTAL